MQRLLDMLKYLSSRYWIDWKNPTVEELAGQLVRANDILLGLCYQRLSRDDNGQPFDQRGLTAVHLDGKPVCIPCREER